MCAQRFDAVDASFSLICAECDAGSHVESQEQAVADGGRISITLPACRWPTTSGFVPTAANPLTTGLRLAPTKTELRARTPVFGTL
jgi:hypothetical protein